MVERRDFLKVAVSLGCASLAGPMPKARATTRLAPGRKAPGSMAVLVDTTKCIGCRSCEAACNEVNKLGKPEAELYDQSVFETRRRPDSNTYTVVNAYAEPDVPFEPTTMGQRITAKTQCMHCQEPACASACFVNALEKTDLGPVVYHEERCVGCRYCMVACPFAVPQFEYEKAVPAIKKCQFCETRQLAGKLPGCAEACPTGALKYGERTALLDEARTRIYQNPDKYVHHIYGEHEVGGTSWLYISSVPFEDIGFRTDLGTTPYPVYTQGFLSAVPLVLIIWPAILMGCHWWSNNKKKAQRTEVESERREG